MSAFITDCRGSADRQGASGFTLIELSIVLVVIGLIVGGVLVGQDLIRAAEVRATISQVEKFNQAVNTFFGKYGALPGDLNAQVAATFGFTPRGQYPGEGDGNGKLEGVTIDQSGQHYGWVFGAGETAMFWVDLTTANGLNVNMIEGGFSAASPTTPPGTPVTGGAIGNWLPAAKLGGGNYFYVHSTALGCIGGSNFWGNANLFGLSAVSSIPTVGAVGTSAPGLTVRQAYDIDKKIDDGLPQTGRVQPLYVDAGAFGGCGSGFAPNAASASSATCFDTTSGNYSITQNGGAGVNCALSFKIQGGD